MKIAIGCDHRGLGLKIDLIRFLKKKGFTVKDFGTFDAQSCDYPLIGYKVAKAVSGKQYARGILICMSGVGFSIVANKIKGIRAVICRDIKTAILSRQHNDANILTLGAGFTDRRLAKRIVMCWLDTKFLGQRHRRRVNQISAIENGSL